MLFTTRTILSIKQNPKTVTVTFAKQPGEKNIDLTEFMVIMEQAEYLRSLAVSAASHLTGTPLGERISAALRRTR